MTHTIVACIDRHLCLFSAILLSFPVYSFSAKFNHRYDYAGSPYCQILAVVGVATGLISAVFLMVINTEYPDVPPPPGQPQGVPPGTQAANTIPLLNVQEQTNEGRINYQGTS